MMQVHEPADQERPPPGGFDHAAARRSILASLILNALCPYLLFRALEPRFPAESILPLLYASLFPVIGFLLARRRKHGVDAIAVIALAGILIHLAVTVLAPNLSMALVLRALEGAIIGACLLVSAAIGRPVMLYVARQFVSAGVPGKRAGFEAMVARGAGRAFHVATIVWGCGLLLMSAVHVALAIYLPHADFVLVSPVLGVVTDVLLLAWSARYILRHVSVPRATQ
ncbi:MAG TPA: VC0807 family protein [Steroidobacteraceae bacterium]